MYLAPQTHIVKKKSISHWELNSLLSLNITSVNGGLRTTRQGFKYIP